MDNVTRYSFMGAKNTIIFYYFLKLLQFDFFTRTQNDTVFPGTFFFSFSVPATDRRGRAADRRLTATRPSRRTCRRKYNRRRSARWCRLPKNSNSSSTVRTSPCCRRQTPPPCTGLWCPSLCTIPTFCAGNNITVVKLTTAASQWPRISNKPKQIRSF